MADAVDEIRSRVDIVELVGQRVALKKTGKDYKGLCPFHDDRNPSFQVSPTIGRYRCWSCGEAGDAFNWVMKTQNVDFREALEILAARTGVTLPKKGQQAPPSQRAAHSAAMSEALAFFRNALQKSTPAKEYCNGRGLDESVLELWEIGFAPGEGSALATHLRKRGHSLSESKSLFLVDEDSTGGYFDKFRDRLMFPIRDEKGDLVAFGGRIMGDGHPKYINSGDTPLFRKSRVLYGMYRAKDRIAKERKAVLVEGYLDVIACHRADVGTAVASLGTSLTDEHAKLLKRWCDGVVILYDSDSAGQKAAERAIEVLEAEGLKVRIALMPEGDDPDTLLKSGGPAAVQRAVSSGLKPIEYRLELLRRRMDPQSDEYWTEALEIVASAPSQREMELYLMRLAPLYPHLRDPVAAQARLRADALALRRRKARGGSSSPGDHSLKSLGVAMSAAERVLFSALLGQEHRDAAFEALAEADLFETKSASDLANAVRDAFKEPPRGEPSQWMHLVQPEESERALADLALTGLGAPISASYLSDTLETLRAKREKRRLHEMKRAGMDERASTEYLETLRKLQAERK